MDQKVEVTKGIVLLAEPFMMDPNFKRTAVLLCEHGAEGSVGFILNKPIKMQVANLLPDFPDFKAEVFFGGPVATDTLHYVHNLGELIDESFEVGHGISWGGNFQQVKALIREGFIQAHNIRFFVGYSGWTAGQLSDELDYGSWVQADFDTQYLFGSQPRKLWKQIMRNKGDRYSVIAQIPDQAMWN